MQKVNRLKVILPKKDLTNLWLPRQLDVNALYNEKVVGYISGGRETYEL